MTQQKVIEVRDFAKTFYLGVRRKRFVAARGLSFDVERGEVFGFLGPNGSGKTTTIKALLGLIRPDGGELKVLGYPASSMAWRAKVGYLPEHPNFYEYLTGFELVAMFARLSGLSAHEAQKEAKRQLERVGLAYAMNRRMRSYSKGMLQRAGLAQALVGSPALLILDEPMTGLDPLGRRDIRELVLELRAEGRTVFYSTHILPDVELTCDRVAMVAKGQVVRCGRLDEILKETAKGFEVVLDHVDDALYADITARNPRTKKSGGSLEIQLESEDEARALVSNAMARGALLSRFVAHKDDLEAIFVRSLPPSSLGDNR
ncbi:MAG: ABC transporter ATP-binding protein [Deltaproteobacteria bacterium]|nr:ABC transporter ATP-binding protein [Deltaproteobacteria bacterium]